MNFYYINIKGTKTMPIKKKSKYITIEGTDGVGKTTLINNLKNYFEQKGKRVLITKEFGSELDPFCKKLRELVLSDAYGADEFAAQMVFAAIAYQHQKKIINNDLFLSQYDIIISDRGIDSNFCYGPAHVQKKEQKLLKDLFKIAYNKSKKPDITILLNAINNFPDKRIKSREMEKFENQAVDRIEKKGLSFQTIVKNNFIFLAKKFPKRIKLLNISENMTAEDVLLKTLMILKKNNIL